MTEKIESTMTEAPAAAKKAAPKAEVKKAPAKKAAPKKATAKKAPVRKAPVKKVEPKGVFDMFEDSVVAVPLKAANKTFMAGLGLLSYMQGELDKQYKEFDKKFTKYAKDGEKVFDKFEDRVEDFRKDVEKKVDEARDRVRHTFNKAA
jgi:hypothetical protein